MERILAFNPGATSTKYAVYDGESEVFNETLEHHGDELKRFATVYDQHQYRLDLLLNALERKGIPLESLNAIVARGGLLKPVPGGTFEVNEAMVEYLKEAPRGEHASNLGAVIAYNLSGKLGIPAYIVDPVAVDEFGPEARLSGHPELPRVSMSHALNSKAVARKVAKEMGKRYDEVNFVVVHLGTGVSVSAHRNGRMIDVNDGKQEGPFSPDRCGTLPAWSLVRLCYSGKYTEREMMRNMQGVGGMYAYLGTMDVREAQKRADNGDELANSVLNAMAYQTAKEVGAMSAVLCGEVDRIIITGGIARSERIVNDISRRVKFIAQIIVIPGEEELPSLVQGALRVLRGEEAPHTNT
jgi:butyrate kinase